MPPRLIIVDTLIIRYAAGMMLPLPTLRHL